MEAVIEILFEFVAEVLLQVLFEWLAEVGLRGLRKPFQKAPHPFVAALGYATFGGVVGGLSLLVFPSHFLASPTLQIANVLVTPVVAGVSMVAIGAWRQRHDQDVLRMNRFTYGFLFAFAMAAVRFAFAH